MYQIETFGGISIANADCMDVMRDLPDNAYDPAICDPPYGIGIAGQKKCVCKNSKHNRKYHENKGWDELPPPNPILGNWKGYHAIKSFGAEITLFPI